MVKKTGRSERRAACSAGCSDAIIFTERQRFVNPLIERETGDSGEPLIERATASNGL